MHSHAWVLLVQLLHLTSLAPPLSFLPSPLPPFPLIQPQRSTLSWDEVEIVGIQHREQTGKAAAGSYAGSDRATEKDVEQESPSQTHVNRGM